MPLRVELAEVAGAEPTVHDRFGGELWIVEIARHDRFAAHPDFADAIGSGIDDFDLHAGEGFADRVGPEWLQVVDGDGGAGFGEAIAVGYGNAEVIEKLQGLRFRERTTYNDGAKVASECGVDLLQQPPAEPKTRLRLGERFVESDEFVEDFAPGGR